MKKLILIAMMCLTLTACGGTKNEPTVLDFSEARYGTVETGDLQLVTGDLLSVTQSGGIVVVKAKIRSNLTNKMTIDQNFSNVGDLIQNHGFNTCEELQYWAVADTNMGEQKVISFTLEKSSIYGIISGSIVWTQLQDLVKDLWILPSLKE